MYRFEGEWITAEEFAERKPVSPYRNVYDGAKETAPGAPADVHVLFRKRAVWKGTGRVYLYFSADDCAKVYINGRFAVQGPAPCYPCHDYYIRKDVTK